MKACIQCGIEKELADFTIRTKHDGRTTLDGHRGVCKKCHALNCVESRKKVKLAEKEKRRLLSFPLWPKPRGIS